MGGQTALVTGASAGLGVDFARLFARDGHDLVLVARREERLRSLAAEMEKQHGIKAAVCPADLRQPDAPGAIVAQLQQAGTQVSYLVNNAGFGSSGPFIERPAQDELDMIAVNVTALTHLTRLLLPDMVARGSGRVLNVASLAGFLPGPYMATYYATKAYVKSFSEALSEECRGTGVSVTVSCPPATATEFAKVAGNDKSKLFQGPILTSEMVAAHAYRAMMKGQTVALPGLRSKVLAGSVRFAFGNLGAKMASDLNRR